MPVSISDFFDRLRESGVLQPQQVESLWQRIPQQRRDLPAEKIVEKLIESERLTAYQAYALLKDSDDPLLLGDYVILQRIGSGGMGQVFKAEHRKLKRIVALKVLPAAAVKSPDAVKRFEREVQAAARLLHPNIVTAFDAGESEGVHFLVMEYVEGQDLSALSKALGSIPVERCVNYVLQAARGLAYAHSRGIVHRDMKPGNLLVDAEGVVKILDMGLARVETTAGMIDRTAPEQLTQSGQVMGTLDFMAPEQAFDTRKADAKSDIYSLGCTLYRLLTGETLYAGDSMVQVIFAHREQPIPSLRSKLPDVPAALDALFQKMVAKVPAGRPASMAEVVALLEAVERGEPPAKERPPLKTARPAPRAAPAAVPVAVAVVSPPAAGGSTNRLAHAAQATHQDARLPIAKPVETQPITSPPTGQVKLSAGKAPASQLLLLIVGGCALVLVLAGIIWAVRNGTKAVKTDTAASATAAGEPSSDGAVANSTQQAARPLAPLPMGKPVDKLAGLLAAEQRTPGVGRWQIDTTAPRFPAVVVAWSPDNRLVALGTSGGDIRIYDAASWRLQTMLAGHTGLVRALAWSPDGSRIASGSDDKTVRLWRADGTPGPIVQGFVKPAAVAWSPSGEWLLVGDANARAPKLQLCHADGTLGPAIASNTQGVWDVAWSPDGKQFAAASQDNTLQIWNVDGTPARNLEGQEAPLRSVAWSRGGQIAAVDTLGTVYVHSPGDKPPQVLSKFGAKVVAFNPEGTQLALGTATSIEIRDLDLSPTQHRFDTTGGLTHLAYGRDGRIAWAGLNAGVWTPGGDSSVLEAASGATALSSSPNSERFVAVHADGRLRWWRSDGSIEESTAGSVPLVAAAWSPDGQSVAAAGGREVFLWTADRQPKPKFDAGRMNLLSLAFSPRSEQVVVAGNLARISDLSGKSAVDLKGHARRVNIATWSSGGHIATSGVDATIRFWDASGNAGYVIDAPFASALSWSPDGKMLAVAYAANKDPRVRLFAPDGTPGTEFAGKSDMRALVWSPDSQHLAGADRSGKISIWKPNGELERTVPAHAWEARALAWSKTDQIISSADDRTLRSWNAATGELNWIAVTLPGGESAAVTSDGKALGSLLVADRALVYLVANESGQIELIPPSKSLKLQ